jgi:hypothetical protein
MTEVDIKISPLLLSPDKWVVVLKCRSMKVSEGTSICCSSNISTDKEQFFVPNNNFHTP